MKYGNDLLASDGDPDEFLEKLPNVEYLEAIARGETPRWDSDKGGYAYGNSGSSEISMGGKSEKKPTIDPQAGDQPDEELPF